MQTLSAGRLLSLDVLRGLTVAAMILVTDPGTYSAVYPPLSHAIWQGTTPTDMIFPCFLVMTGVALTLSLGKRMAKATGTSMLLLGILRRTVLLILLGLLVNGFPFYHWHTLRLPGILQRIGVCYGFGATGYLLLRRHYALDTRRERLRILGWLAVSIAGLLLLYAALLRWVPVPGFGPGHLDTNGNLAAYVDRTVFGVRHLWPWGLTPGIGITFDPEGLLSTLGALATLLMGVTAGQILRGPGSLARRGTKVAAVGAALVGFGLALQPLMPLIKKIWTPTFACLSGGVSLLGFALLLWLIDIRQWHRWTMPFRVFGTNAILAFAFSSVITGFLIVATVHGQPVHTWLYQHGFVVPWLPPRVGSLLYALCVVLLNFLVLLPFYRRQCFVRV